MVKFPFLVFTPEYPQGINVSVYANEKIDAFAQIKTQYPDATHIELIW